METWSPFFLGGIIQAAVIILFSLTFFCDSEYLLKRKVVAGLAAYCGTWQI